MFCPKCGIELSGEEKYCKKCGFEIVRRAENSVQEKNEASSPKNEQAKRGVAIKVLIIVCALIAIGGIAGVIYAVVNSDGDPESQTVGAAAERMREEADQIREEAHRNVDEAEADVEESKKEWEKATESPVEILAESSKKDGSNG